MHAKSVDIFHDSVPEKLTLEEQFMNYVEYGDYEGVRRCINEGVNPNYISSTEYQTALHIAAERGSIELMQILSESKNLNPNPINLFGQTPFLISSKFGKIKCLIMLLKMGADINYLDAMNQNALHKVIMRNDPVLALFLLKRGIEVNAVDAFDKTPLLITATNKKPNMDMIKLLLFYGANVNQKFKNGYSILLECTLSCCDGSHINVIKYLVHKGARLKVVEPISEKGVLHLVAITGCSKLLVLFLSYGILNLRKMDAVGNTPLDIAKMHRHKHMQHLLEDAIQGIASVHNVSSANIL